MRTPRSLLAAALLLAVVGAPARGDQAADYDVQILVDAIRANKKALVAANLPLTGDEAAKFWPVYERYQTEMNAVQDRLVRIVEQYTSTFKTMSDDDARKLASDYLAVESDRAKVRASYLEPFSKVLPGRKLVRLFQIENKMDAVQRYELAEVIPVIDE
jgi:hypothetical protein